MTNWGQNANLVNSVMDLSIREIDEFDFFKGIDRFVYKALYFIHTWVSALS